MANRRDAGSGDSRALLEQAFYAAVAAADPGNIPAEYLPDNPAGRMVVVGAGKAGAAMAAAVERHYGSDPAIEGLVLIPDGSAGSASDSSRSGTVESGGGEATGAIVAATGETGTAAMTTRIELSHASHPMPDQRGVAATRRMLAMVRACTEEDRVIVLLSGGGSALLCAPDGLELDEKVELTEALLRSGARIEEMNAVRKHLSQVKGGRLALLARPAPVTTLVLSDVVGDDLSTIASGPTVGDPTTFADALGVLDRYGIDAPSARRPLEEGRAGRRPETPKPGDPRLEHVKTFLLGNNQGSLEAAAAVLVAAGYRAHILTSSLVGEAREAGGMHAAVARQILGHGQPFEAPCALISGGETTVTVRSRGRGGRNSEFALGMALELPRSASLWALAADTDGRDGSEANAGVFISPGLLAGLEPAQAREALDSNDSYDVFARSGHLLTTGSTGTNVNDLRILLIGEPAGQR